MAYCSVCGGVVVRGDISLAGSEVFHKACIRTHGTASSELNRAKTKALTADQTRHADAVVHQQVLERRDAIIRDLNAENRELRAENLKLEMELARQRLTVVAQRAEITEAEGNVQDAERERDQAIAARDAAIREAALHQTIQRSSPVSSQRDMVTVPVEVDDRDPTEVRFSLLDLDLDKK